jgi:hypothetical protein
MYSLYLKNQVSINRLTSKVANLMSENFILKAKIIHQLGERPVEVSLPQAYLDSNMISIPEQLTKNSSLIREMSGHSLFAVHSTHYINNIPKK